MTLQGTLVRGDKHQTSRITALFSFILIVESKFEYAIWISIYNHKSDPNDAKIKGQSLSPFA